MKSKKNLLIQLNSLPHFSKDTIYQLASQMGLAKTTTDTYISRFLKYKEILRLKRGLYVSDDYFEKNRLDISYSFFLANIIRSPSYVSSWAALQYYNLATEAIHTITSVTPKVTRDYESKAGNFAYQSINNESFSGFSLFKGKFDFFIASPAKALFDLLYFRTRQFRGIKKLAGIKKLTKELRIDIDEMEAGEQKKFYSLISKFV
ncbi:hypothetical protein EPN28_00090 [Patescibacteria group bacterium]|nr:MAG: hypothetical protein EPN28_00090 [Patescibacteria group bacterium]